MAELDRVVYSISGENAQGEEVTVFKAGFDSTGKSAVTVGENAVTLDNMIENPAGGTAGQVLTKTATSTEWKTPESGFPTSANAGDAIVYNGTTWAKQDGYGYLSPSTLKAVTWDGNTTGKYSVSFFKDYTFYNISTTMYTLEELSDCEVTIRSGDEDFVESIPSDAFLRAADYWTTIGAQVPADENPNDIFLYKNAETVMFVINNDFTATIDDEPITFLRGTYFYGFIVENNTNIQSTFVKKFTSGHAEFTSTIAKKYLYEAVPQEVNLTYNSVQGFCANGKRVVLEETSGTQPCIKIGNTILTEEKLQQLLALLNE